MIDRKALPFDEAMGYASIFTSGNQAELQRVYDRTGSIETGKLADLTVLRVEGEPGKCKVEVEHTLVAGNVFSF